MIMGVAGCGKSSVGSALASLIGARLIEGDDYHSPASREKMVNGIALTDADRQGWLETLGNLLRCAPHRTVLTCSALKRAYRDTLRVANPDLRYIHLAISPAESWRRVTARAGEHFFPGNLVNSQFAALETPDNEVDVLTVDATLPVSELAKRAAIWLASKEHA